MTADPALATTRTAKAPGEPVVRRWMTVRIAAILQLRPEEVRPDDVLAELGLSSIQAIELAADIEEWTGREVSATLVYECPTVRDAAREVAALVAAA